MCLKTRHTVVLLMRTVITIVEYLLFCAYRGALSNTSLLELPAVFLQRIASHARCDS